MSSACRNVVPLLPPLARALGRHEPLHPLPHSRAGRATWPWPGSCSLTVHSSALKKRSDLTQRPGFPQSPTLPPLLETYGFVPADSAERQEKAGLPFRALVLWAGPPEVGCMGRGLWFPAALHSLGGPGPRDGSVAAWCRKCVCSPSSQSRPLGFWAWNFLRLLGNPCYPIHSPVLGGTPSIRDKCACAMGTSPIG